MAIKANITIDQGADFTATIDVKAADGSILDLNSYTATSQMRKNFASSNASAAFTCTDDGAGGKITIKLTNAQTSLLEPGRYLYDVEIANNDSTPIITRVVQGTATVTGGITRS